MLFVLWLFVVCCLSVYCLCCFVSFVVYYSLFVVRCVFLSLFIVCCLLFVVRRRSSLFVCGCYCVLFVVLFCRVLVACC